MGQGFLLRAVVGPLRIPSALHWLLIPAVLGALLGSARKVQALGTPDSFQVKAALEKVEAEIRDLEDIRRKIEQEHHVFLLIPGAGVLIDHHQAGDVFGRAVFMGAMHPDSVPGAIRALLGVTRIYLNTYVLGPLADLKLDRQKLLTDLATLRNPDQPPMVEDDPTRIRRAGGTWSVKCLISDVESTDGGSFLLEVIPSGAISGTYEGSGGRFAVTGYRFADGSARGGGSNASGTFEWSGALRDLGNAPFSGGGPVGFTASSGGTCTGSWTTS